MWELDWEESWALKNWCFWTLVLEKTLESPLDCKEIQPVHSKGDRSWVFIGRTDAKAETPRLWPPHVKSWLIGKESDAGRDWGQEEKGTTEDEMAGWHHRLDGHEFGWTLGAGDGQGGLVCCDSWGCKESDTTERLNWTEIIESRIRRLNIVKMLILSKFICRFFLLVGMQTSTATMENSVEIPLKTGNRTALWSSNPTAGHTHWGNQNGKRHVYPNVHHSTVYNSQDMEAT